MTCGSLDCPDCPGALATREDDPVAVPGSDEDALPDASIDGDGPDPSTASRASFWAAEVKFVDAKLLLIICVSDPGIDTVVVDHRTNVWIVEDSLPTGPVDEVVAFEYNVSTTLEAACPTGICEWTNC